MTTALLRDQVAIIRSALYEGDGSLDEVENHVLTHLYNAAAQTDLTTYERDAVCNELDRRLDGVSQLCRLRDERRSVSIGSRARR